MNERSAVEFPFGGRLCLDFTWTVRFRAVRPTETLVAPRDLSAWLRQAGLPAAGAADDRDLVRARTLREAVYRAASAVAERRGIHARDREVLNRFAALAPPAPSIGRDGRRRLVVPAGRECEAALGVIARDAIDLLTAGDGRLRRCEGPRCSLLFHDGSRPGTRRWCATARCGNRVNTRSYRARKRGATDDG
ncbi:MAG: CGNR zinc finger domain-containing protein [Alphaproteobacteria bacterium]